VTRPALALAVLLLADAPLSRAQTPAPAAPAARAELDDLRQALDAAVARAARPRPVHLRHASGHAYRLKGYGAIVVLAPRALPQRVAVRKVVPARPAVPAGVAPFVIEIPELTIDVTVPDLGDLQRQMEAQMAAQAAALREMEIALPRWTGEGEEELKWRVRLVEEQAEAFRREAERARRQMEREVWSLVPPPVPAPNARPAPPAPPAPVAPVSAVAPPAAPAASAAPAPAAPRAPAVSDLVDLPAPAEPPPPPWRFWFDVTDGEAAAEGDPEEFVASVRDAIAAGLAGYQRPLTSLGPDEVVTVAVDLVPDRMLRKAPARTLLVRARARDLRDRQAGRLTAAALRQRLEFEEN
jgi:hypothetical protein